MYKEILSMLSKINELIEYLKKIYRTLTQLVRVSD